MKKFASTSALGLFSILTFVCLLSGCSVAESKTAAVSPETQSIKTAVPATKGATIKIEPNGPADVVRVFYGHLREKRFRAAIYLTNLRPAIEELSDTELKDFQVDLENVASFVPAEIEINGEIISGDQATVTAKLPGEDPDKTELQELRLRKDKNGWVILTADETAEKRIKTEGKLYLRNLRIETHHAEAKAMLNRIAKAQMAYAAQNGGKYADMKTLVDARLLADDALSAESTGYAYTVTVTEGGSKYWANATPAEYGKSGLTSFMVRLSENGSPLLNGKDMGGKPMVN